MNSFTTIGKIAHDAVVMEAANSHVCNFMIHSETGIGKSQKAMSIDCAIWGSRATQLFMMLTRGRQVLVMGEIFLKEFKKKDGTHASILHLVVDRIEIMPQHNSELETE